MAALPGRTIWSRLLRCKASNRAKEAVESPANGRSSRAPTPGPSVLAFHIRIHPAGGEHRVEGEETQQRNQAGKSHLNTGPAKEPADNPLSRLSPKNAACRGSRLFFHHWLSRKHIGPSALVLHPGVGVPLYHLYSFKPALFHTTGDEIRSEKHEVYVDLFAEELVQVNGLFPNMVGEKENTARLQHAEYLLEGPPDLIL